MKLSDYIKNEEFRRLEITWPRLAWWQRKSLLLQAWGSALPVRLLNQLRQHIQRRRIRFAYWFPAHWVN